MAGSEMGICTIALRATCGHEANQEKLDIVFVSLCLSTGKPQKVTCLPGVRQAEDMSHEAGPSMSEWLKSMVPSPAHSQEKCGPWLPATKTLQASPHCLCKQLGIAPPRFRHFH